MKEISFTASIKNAPGKTGGSYIEFPYKVQEVFGHTGRIKVVCYFDDFEYKGSLVKMGTECHIIGIRKDILKIIKKKEEDIINVRLYEDLEERIISPNESLSRILNTNSSLKTAYESLSYTTKKEINQLLKTAKKEETKDRRLKEIIERLKIKSEFRIKKDT